MAARSKTVDPLTRIRKIISAWPETEERISHGMPTFWGGKKTFARYVDAHHGARGIAAWIKSDPESQEALIASDSKTFFLPPYVGPSGWIGVRLDGKIDWDLVAELLESGYRSGAPKRALKILDGL